MTTDAETCCSGNKVAQEFPELSFFLSENWKNWTPHQ